MIEIDGSIGEGGGQILRTSLALSMCTNQPFVITNIRSKRAKPGLLRQHLTAVNAAQSICGAQVTGAGIASRTLTFAPGKVLPGEYRFAVGTAGSATLVLQTVLPPLLCASGHSVIHLEGGTHNSWAPPFHFLQKVFIPIVNRMGPKLSADLYQWGFYPAGGGKGTVRISPAPGPLARLDLWERGNLVRAEILTAVAQIPFEIADDEARLINKGVRFPVESVRAETVNSIGPGNVAMLGLEYEHSTAWFTGFGAMGVSRQKVAHLVSAAANTFHQGGAAVEEHLADQLLIPLALAGGGGFTTVEPSMHTTTNMEIIRKFIDVNFETVQEKKGVWKITAQGAPDS